MYSNTYSRRNHHMLTYEESRTENIVKRLVTIASVVKYIVIVSTALSVAGSFAAFGMLTNGDGVAAAVVGAVVGVILGIFFASLVVVLIEWYAQVLVALENVVALQRKK
jgi:hypothetical protein